MKKTSLTSIAGMFATLMSAGCDDIHIGDPWDTASVRVTANEAALDDARVDSAVAPPEAKPVITFEWDGFIAEEVRVEECTYDCDNQPTEFCWNKSDDYIEHAVLPAQAQHEDAGCGWAVGACSSFADCDPSSEGVVYADMISAKLDYGAVPPKWFAEEGSQAIPLRDGATYAVGVFGFDCSGGEPCQEVFGCRFFRMEDGRPVMMQGT